MDVCGWLNAAICHLVPRATPPLGGLVDAGRVVFLSGFQAGPQYPWS